MSMQWPQRNLIRFYSLIELSRNNNKKKASLCSLTSILPTNYVKKEKKLDALESEKEFYPHIKSL